MKKRWYEKPPPKWYRMVGKIGIWTNLLISTVALIMAILNLIN